ncbi:hypothetical protein MTBLM1_70205 [Rhodospirillaceae bacterium LM-1]|nr:hypothetical protein MTBLM1_70205 [Rhodospirillaceae bacterium LM-1]
MRPRRFNPRERIAALKKENEELRQVIMCLQCPHPCVVISDIEVDLPERLLEPLESMGLAGNRFGTKRAKPH